MVYSTVYFFGVFLQGLLLFSGLRFTAFCYPTVFNYSGGKGCNVKKGGGGVMLPPKHNNEEDIIIKRMR